MVTQHTRDTICRAHIRVPSSHGLWIFVVYWGEVPEFSKFKVGGLFAELDDSGECIFLPPLLSVDFIEQNLRQGIVLHSSCYGVRNFVAFCGYVPEFSKFKFGILLADPDNSGDHMVRTPLLYVDFIEGNLHQGTLSCSRRVEFRHILGSSAGIFLIHSWRIIADPDLVYIDFTKRNLRQGNWD